MLSKETLKKIKTNDESQEARKEGRKNADRYVDLLTKFSEKEINPVDFLKNTEPENIERILKNLNYLLNGLEVNEEMKDHEFFSAELKMGDPEFGPTNLSPSKNYQDIFKKNVVEIQNEINEENQKKQFLKIFLLINFLHLFPNGNGRTSRFLYQKLNGCEPMGKTAISRNPEIMRILDDLNERSIASMFKKYNITELKNFDPGETVDTTDAWDEVAESYKSKAYSKDGLNYGYADILKFLARKKVEDKIDQDLTGNLGYKPVDEKISMDKDWGIADVESISRKNIRKQNEAKYEIAYNEIFEEFLDIVLDQALNKKWDFVGWLDGILLEKKS